MQNLVKYLAAGLVGLLVGYFLAAYVGGDAVGGVGQFQSWNFIQGFTAGTTRQLSVTNAGVLTTSGAVNFDGAADFDAAVDFSEEITLSGNNCSSASWNPGAVGSTTVSGVEVTMPSGYAIGDLLLVGFNTSTQGLQLTVQPSGTKAWVLLSDDDDIGTAIDVATGTLKVCYFD